MFRAVFHSRRGKKVHTSSLQASQHKCFGHWGASGLHAGFVRNGATAQSRINRLGCERRNVSRNVIHGADQDWPDSTCAVGLLRSRFHRRSRGPEGLQRCRAQRRLFGNLTVPQLPTLETWQQLLVRNA